MQLLAAARAEELRAQAVKLAPEIERHQVAVEYLASPEQAQALQRAQNAKTPKAARTASTVPILTSCAKRPQPTSTEPATPTPKIQSL